MICLQSLTGEAVLQCYSQKSVRIHTFHVCLQIILVFFYFLNNVSYFLCYFLYLIYLF
jgi:hypothetical protein